MALGKIFALVIFYGAYQAGNSINTDLKFTTLAACEEAARAINTAQVRGNGSPGALCVRGD